jgi:riboflavin kinase/FMN adenylyltransferase
VLPFTPPFARLPPESFVERVLVAAAVLVGANFSFGHRGVGDGALLHEVGASCSSTYIRERLRAGDVRGAARALPAPGLYIARVDGGRRTAVEVTPGGGLLVVAEGPVSAEFLDSAGPS